MGGTYSVRSGEELFTARQSHELFMAGLSERELKILQMKEDETPIEKIAQVLGMFCQNGKQRLEEYL